MCDTRLFIMFIFSARGPSPPRQPYKFEQDIFCFHHQVDLKLDDRDFMFYVVMMDDGRIVSSIMNNKSPGPMLYIFNINGPLEYMIPVRYNSHGITAIDNSTVAVTACNSIDMYDINNRVHLKSIVLSGIEFDTYFCGMYKITTINNNLVVGKDNGIVIIDHQTGDVVKTIDTNGTCTWCVHGTSDKIFYCGNKVNNIYCYNYSDDKIDIMTLPSRPWSITSLQDGSVYVACVNGSVQHVSSDCKSYKTVTTEGLAPLEKPSVMSYNPKQGKLVICSPKGMVKVFDEV